MARWTCPKCERQFDLRNQSHVCAPGGSVADTFAGYPLGHRAIYDAVIRHLRSLGRVHEDAVKIGVFLKRQRKLAEVRPMMRSVTLWVALPRAVQDSRVDRRMKTGLVVLALSLAASRVAVWSRCWLAQRFA
jgi:hypothetical protein